MILKAMPYTNEATLLARMRHDEFVTPEHVFSVMIEEGAFNLVAESCGLDLETISYDLGVYFDEISTPVGNTTKFEAEASNALVFAVSEINKFVRQFGYITDGAIAEVLLNSDTEYLRYCFEKQEINVSEFIDKLYNIEKAEIESRNQNSKNYGDQLEPLKDLMHFLSNIPDGSGFIMGRLPANGNMPGYLDEMMGIESQQEESREGTEDSNPKREKAKNEISRYCTKVNVQDMGKFVGREELIEKTLETLCRMKKNNVLHIGDPGVGKTALVYGLAKHIQDGEVPDSLKDAEIYKVDLSGMVAGSKFRGEFEERLKKLLNNAVSSNKVTILYFDEAHMLVGAGNSAEVGMDASNILKEYITSKGNLRIIGSTTYEEYSKTIAKNKALDRRFRCLFVTEPTEEETKEIVKGLVDEYSNYHGVRYTEKALLAAVELTNKYVKDKYQPDKAIDIIDESGSYAKMNGITDIDVDTVETVLSRQYKIPREEVMSDETEKLRNLSNSVESVVFGQRESIEAIVDKIQYYRAGMVPENNPIGSFIAVGPTGVGKTELAKAIANEMNMHFVRFDMSEFSERHSVSKLIGSPPGYIGHTNGGLLVSEVKKHPNCVLLLDEIEKADSSVFDVLLQVMDNAILTDGTGEKADFRGVLIIMTSNAGATYDAKKKLGFSTGEDIDETSDNMSEALKDFFRPEFLARVDKVLKFNPLDDKTSRLIAVKKLEDINSRIARKGIKITYSDKLLEHLCSIGINRETGARGLQRMIDSGVGVKIKDEILFGDKKSSTDEDIRVIHIDYKDSEVVLQ